MKIATHATALLLALLLLSVGLAALPVSAAADTVYLGDRQDLFLGRDSLDGFGWNTAHSGEPITIGKQKFDKGLGFHCLPDKDADSFSQIAIRLPAERYCTKTCLGK